MTSTLNPDDLRSSMLPPEEERLLFADSEIPQPDLKFSFLDQKLAAFMRSENTGTAKDYERKIGGLITAGVETTISNVNLVPDAAALIAYGDKVSKTGGALAAEDPRFAKMVDFLAVPANPYVMFAMAILPLASQLLRNHEEELSAATRNIKGKRAQRKAMGKAPKVKAYVTIPGINRKIRVPFKMKISLKVLTGTSVDPTQLANSVFTSPDVQRALARRGIKIG